MKKILVATDTSNAGINAFNYTMNFVNHFKNNLFKIQYLIINDKGDSVENAQQDFDPLSYTQIKSNFPADFLLPIQSVNNREGLYRVINDLVKENGIQKVILGVEAHTAQNKFMDQEILNVINYCTQPVMMIPSKANFKPFEKVIIVCEKEFSINSTSLDPIIKLNNYWQADIDVLKIDEGISLPDNDPLILEYSLKSTQNVHFFSRSRNLKESLENFLKEIEIDLIAFCSSSGFYKYFYDQPKPLAENFQYVIPLLTFKN